jgi:hypothetical protein
MSDSYETICASVDKLLADAGVIYTVRHRGEGHSPWGDGWPCDQWEVQFQNGRRLWATDYYTGMGRRKPAPEEWDVKYRPTPPKAADVVKSLLLDAEANSQSFADWCENLGYSEDSLKAFDTYRACCEIGKKLRAVFDRDTLEKLREATADL